MEPQNRMNSASKPLPQIPVKGISGVNRNTEVNPGSAHTAVPNLSLDGASSNQTMTDNSRILSNMASNTTVKEVGKFFKASGGLAIRALAGVGGAAIFGGTALGGMALVAAIALPAFAITASTALLGAIIGGAIGAQDDSEMTKSLRAKFGNRGAGVVLGAMGGAALPVMAYLLTEGAASIPKTAFVTTVGFLGTGLLAFSITGKRERDQHVAKNMDTTNEKLHKALFMCTVPVWKSPKSMKEFLKGSTSN
jgi:hypothetical protein